MKHANSFWQRLLSVLLCMALVLSIAPVSVFADDGEQGAPAANEGKAVHTVIFQYIDENGVAQAIVSQQITDGESAAAPDVPMLSQKIFTGWDKDFSAVTEDMTVTAQYEDIQAASVAVAYQYPNGASAAASVTAQVAAGQAYDKLVPFPEVPGFTVSKVKVTPAEEFPEDVEDTVGDIQLEGYNANVTVTAEGIRFSGVISEAVQVTVTYTGVPAQYTVKHIFDTANGYVENEAVRETLWGVTGIETEAVAKDVEGYTAQPVRQQIIAANGDTTVEVRYERNTYLLTWDTGVGGSYIAPQLIKVGDAITEPSAPTRPGYVFNGWNEHPSEMPNNNLTVSAQWSNTTNASYTVIYWQQSVTDDKNAADANKTYEFVESVQKTGEVGSSTSYETKSYDFFTLNTNKTSNTTIAADGSTVVNVYYDRQLITFNFIYSIFRTVTMTGLYGQTLAQNGYTWDGSYYWVNGNINYTFLDAFIPSSNTATVDFTKGSSVSGNFTFHHMKEQPDGTWVEANSVKYANGSNFNISNKYDGYTVTEYSSDNRNWTSCKAGQQVSFSGRNGYIRYYLNTYSISFLNCTGVSNVSVKYSASISSAMPDPDAVKAPAGIDSDYVLAGWYTSPACTEGTEVNWNSTMPSHNLAVYAKWQAPVYTVTFDANGGELAEGTEPISGEKYFVIGDNMPADPTRANFVFGGWYTDPECKTPFVAEQKIVSDMTVYAKWNSTGIYSYKVKAVDEDGNVLATSDPADAAANSYVTVSAIEVDGYSPNMVSQNVKIEKDGQEIVFVYTKAEAWSATVHYYLADGSAVAEDSVFSGIMGESRLVYPAVIDGYEVVGSYVQTVTRTEPEVTFFYQPILNPVYTVKVYLDGVLSSTNTYFDVRAGFASTITPSYIDGYTTPAAQTKYVAKDGSTVFELRYEPVDVEYTVKYMYGETELAPSETLPGKYNRTVTANAKEFAGYEVDANSKNLTLALTDNVIVFNYSRTEFTVTVNYVYADGSQAEETVRQTKSYNEEYSIASPVLEGYTADKAEVSGIVTGDVTVTVTYTAKDVSYTVKYVEQNTDNPVADPKVVNNVKFGTEVTESAIAVTGYELVGEQTQSIESLALDNNVITFEYAKRSYALTIKYQYEDGTQAAEDHTAAVPYGDVYKVGSPAIAGYTADKAEVSGTMPAEDVNVTVTYKANTNTEYKVQHWFQNLDDDDYTMDSAVDQRSGTTGEQTAAEAREVAGFTAQLPIEQKTIAGDGSTVVYIYYDRNTYTITYKITGTVGANDQYAADDYKYQQNVTAKETPDEIEGYTFVGWTGEPETMSAYDVEVTGYYKPNDNTAYKVEHYLQNLAGDGYDLKDTDNLKGTTDTTANAVAKSYEGFSFDDTVEGTLTSGTIAADGGLVLRLYYTRNSYTVSYKYEGTVPEGASMLPAEAIYKYGESVAVAGKASALGYTFYGWNTSDAAIEEGSFTVPAKNVELTGYFTANTDTEYTVKYYYQNIDNDEYTLNSSEVKTGTTGDMTNVTAAEITGFTLKDFDQQVIAPDGSTVVEVYYDRNSYTVTYNITGDIDAKNNYAEKTYKFEQDVAKLAEPVKAGYEFHGWTGEPNTMPAEDVEVTGYFTANTDTVYTVRHWLQNLDDDGYTMDDSEEKTGTTDTLTAAAAKAYAGFTAQDFDQQTITGDGKTVVDIYYTRNSYTVTYSYTGTVPEGASELPAETTYKYGATVTVADDAAATGYTFSGWSRDGEFTMPAEDVTITGKFIANTDTKYVIERYYQNADDDEYTLVPEECGGTTGAEVSVNTDNHDNFHYVQKDDEVLEGTIAADGGLVLKVWFDRDVYTVTYNITGDIDPEDNYAVDTYKVGQKVEKLSEPVKTGYTFSGWSGEPNTMPAENVTVTGYFTAKDVSYTVRYVEQGTDNSVAEAKVVSGVKFGTKVTANAITVTGYDLAGEATQSIESLALDNNVITFEYIRHPYTLTIKYQYEDGTPAAEDHTAAVSYGNDYEVDSPVIAGYTANKAKVSGTMPAEDVNVTVTYTANNDTKYTVKHHYEDFNGGYDTNVVVDEAYTGTTGDKTNAQTQPKFGFTAREFEQQIIAGNGSTVVDIYYDRNVHTVTYEYTNTVPGASELPATVEYKFGATVTVADDAAAPGYTFSGWSTGNFTMGDEPVVITGSFTARDDTAYTVVHMTEELDGHYIEHSRDGSKTGTTGAMTNATSISIAGFTAQEFEQKTIAGDGSTIVYIYYDRNVHTVTYKYDGTVPTGASKLPAAVNYKYGADVKIADAATAPGYTFSGWSVNEDFTMGDANVEIIGSFTANNNTAYKVEYYLQNLAGDEYVLDETKNLTGTTDTTANAEVKSFDGFEFNEEKSITSGTITGDGLLTLKLYYDRNSYTVTYQYTNTVPGASELPETVEYKYGATVTVAEKASAPGYDFNGWDRTGDFTMPAENVTITGYFTARNDTAYTVIHKTENIDGTYADHSKVRMTGVTGEQTKAEAISIEGFTAQNFEQKTITGDGLTVVEIKYTRNSYPVTYKYDGTVPTGASDLPETVEYKYGADVPAADAATAPGYTFSGWKGEVSTMPAKAVEVIGSFTANNDTAYKVEYYLQNLAGDAYVLDETKNLTGTTDTTANADVKSYEGFKFNEGASTISGNISGNGSLVLKLYYDRLSYEVSYYVDNVLSGEVETYKYGAEVAKRGAPEKAGYTFNGWSTNTALEQGTEENSFIMPAQNVAFEAVFTANGDTEYNVKYWLEKVDGEYELDADNSYTGNGETDTTATAVMMGYEGFKFNEDKSVTSGNIAGDGSLVLDLYYDRLSYDVTYQYVDGDILPEVSAPDSASYRFGETFVPTEDAADIPGYTFSGWSTTNAEPDEDGNYTMPIGGVLFTGSYTANTDTKYTVITYYQNVENDEYTAAAPVEFFDGVTGQQTNVTADEVYGFQLKPIDQQTVKGDGSTVVYVYYDRLSYTVSYQYDGSQPVNAPIVPMQQSYRYESTAAVAEAPSLEGYTFTGWNAAGTEPDENGEFTVTGNTAFLGGWTVNYYPTEIRYYFDGELNESMTVAREQQFGSVFTVNPAKTFSIGDTDYALIRVETTGAIVTTGENVISVYYGIDSKGQPDPTNPGEGEGDSEPDEYQTVFTFVSSGNGTVTGSVYETYTDATYTAKPAASPRALVGVVPNAGYAFLNWTDSLGNTYATIDEIRAASFTEDVTFTANFAPVPQQPQQPDTPVIPQLPPLPEIQPLNPVNIDDNNTPVAGPTEPVVTVDDPTIENIDDEATPLAGGDGHRCCILHFLILCAALIIELIYVSNMKKRQQRIFELRRELGK